MSRLLIWVLRTPIKTVFGLAFTAWAVLLSPGCSPSSQRAEDNASADIRGKPIDSPQPAPTQAVASAVPPVSTNAAPANDSAKTEPTIAQRETPSPSAEKPAPPKEEVADSAAVEFLSVTFEKLASFTFEIPDDQPSTNSVAQTPQSSDQIPATVKALDQRKVALKGFMLPLRVESGLVTEMLIMRDQSMCCYGTVPKITEWVSVKMTEKGVKAIMDQPVTIFGKLRVGEMRENGYLVGIYAMDGEKMAGPLDL